ncbi:hypothetical protein EDB84DRAFT_1518723 [Lactarius hengduanensis]|nr:hypothetical protein EDB84DRAFT_1518723 [Lactarius hengduanensis]
MAAASARFVMRASAFFPLSASPVPFQFLACRPSGTPLGVPLSFAEFPLTTGTWVIDELQICEMRTGLYVYRIWQISGKRRSRTNKETAVGNGMEMIIMFEMAVRLSRYYGTHSHTNSECREVSCKFSTNYGSWRYWSQMPLTSHSNQNVVHWQRLFESYKFQ